MTTATATVVQSADDGYAFNNALTTTYGIPVASGVTDLTGFARFASLDVPQGATITSAILSISSWSSSSSAPNCRIYAAAADDPTTPTTSTAVTTATLTTASVAWAGSSAPTGPIDAPDLSAVIQEIVNRPGWQPGNALMLLTKFASAAPSGISPNDRAETLTVTYATGPTAAVWDGTSEQPATVTVWDGTSEQPCTLDIAS